MRDSDGWLAAPSPGRLPASHQQPRTGAAAGRLGAGSPRRPDGPPSGGPVLRARSDAWAAWSIFRGREDYPFDEGDVWLAESIGDVLALSIGVSVHSAEMNHFFAASLELLCMIDFRAGHLHRLNPQWDHMLGYDPQELEGALFLDLVHPDDRATTSAAFGDLREAQVPAQFVNRFRARDGSYRSMEWLARPGADLSLRLGQGHHRAARPGTGPPRERDPPAGPCADHRGLDLGDRQRRPLHGCVGQRPGRHRLPAGRSHRPHALDFMMPEEAGRIAPIFAQMTERREGCGASSAGACTRKATRSSCMTACVPIFNAAGSSPAFSGRGQGRHPAASGWAGPCRRARTGYRLIAENTNRRHLGPRSRLP